MLASLFIEWHGAIISISASPGGSTANLQTVLKCLTLFGEHQFSPKNKGIQNVATCVVFSVAGWIVQFG